MTRHLLILALLVFCAVQPRASTAGASEPPPLFGPIAGWGDNTWGQIDPATCCNAKLRAVNGPAGAWSAIAAGERVTVATRPDGTVWEWGQSDSSTICTLLCLPAQVPGLHDVMAVATSFLDLRLALESDGTVWQWQSTRERAPFQVPGVAGIVQIAVGGWFALALGANGTVWEWSYSYDPKAGVQPYQVAGLPFIRSIAAGSAHALALSADGEVWTWGAALDLAGGNPKTTPPIKVDGLAHIAAIAAGDRFSLALDDRGTVWSWGYNIYGELGEGTSGGGTNAPAPVAGLSNVTSISAQAFHAVALRSDGTVWTWGENQFGIDGVAHLLFLQELTYGISPPPAGFTVRDSRTGHLIRQIGGQFVPSAADPTNGNVIAANRQGKAEVLNPRTWEVMKRLSLPAGPLSVTVSRNPPRFIVVSGSEDSAVVTFYAL